MTTGTRLTWLLLATAACAVGCGRDDEGAVVTDAGADTSSPDTGAPPGDSGTVDSGTDSAVTPEAGGETASDASVPIVPGLVFDDEFAPGVSVADFGGATNAYAVDKTTFHAGTASLAVTVPASGYTGAACVSADPQSLSAFDALTFWAKADAAGTLDTVGFGNSIGSTTAAAEVSAIALTTAWTRYVVPIPRAAVLSAEKGLFYFATGGGAPFKKVWFDDVKFESLGAAALGTPTAALKNAKQSLALGGAKGQVGGASVTWTIDGKPVVVHPVETQNPGWPYFTYTSDTPSIATVDAKGAITPVAVGAAKITAAMGSVPVTGAIDVDVSVPVVPTTSAPTPTLAATDVYSLFGTAYPAKPVDTWLATWSSGKLVDPFLIGSHPVKQYQALGFIGIEFTSTAKQIDATAYTAFHLDVWTAGASFLVKFVDFGADGKYGGGDDSEAEVKLTASSTPALTPKAWASLEIPFSAFLAVNPAWKRAHLAQLIFSSADATVQTAFVDNLYLHK